MGQRLKAQQLCINSPSSPPDHLVHCSSQSTSSSLSWLKMVELQLGDIDQQLQSPLYDGTISPDIRECIFAYAMAEYVDSECLYPKNTDYTRPNYLGKKKVSINLLLLCKRSYLETRHLPPVNKEHVFWHSGGPDEDSDSDLEDDLHDHEEQRYFERFQPFQLALVKEIHLFTQQHWLEGSFHEVCKLDVLQGIEKIKITIRRGDWTNTLANEALFIAPHYKRRFDALDMKEDWQKEARGEVVTWDPGCWGSSFRLLRSLKEVEMEFETYDYKKGELEEIVHHAVKWQFPMGHEKVLTNVDGLGGVKTSSWQGPPRAWSDCPSCEGNSAECTLCDQMVALHMQGMGPMLTVISGLRWKLAPGVSGR